MNPYYQSSKADFTIYHGDCMQIIGQLSDNSVDIIFADPPYFLSNGGISVQSGKQVCVDKGDWDKGGNPESIYQFNKQWISLCRSKLKDNGTIWISGTHHNIFIVQRCLQELGFKILNVITWQKSDPPPNISCRYFNFSTELVIWARKHEKKPHKFNYEIMKQLNGGSQMTDVWRIPSVGMWEKTCGKHPTQKTLRLLYRIILASTNEGDTILDPFAGSSTTGIAANLLGRKFIGVEQDEKFVKLSICRRTLLDNPIEKENLKNKMCETPNEVTVLVNHARPKDYQLMLEHGLCYLRAGDSKGSILVKKGFERLGYVLLHSNGEAPQLFPLIKKGFQIWTSENLQRLGFTAENAPYYAVLRFDAKTPISYNKLINLKQRAFTNVAKIRLLSDFIELK